MRQWLLKTAGVALFSSFFLVSPAAAAANVYVRIGPPARVVEVRPVARHRGYVWQDGYHRWNGHRYVWVNGRYVRPPYARAVWTSGNWSRSQRGWYWAPGHWVRR